MSTVFAEVALPLWIAVSQWVLLFGLSVLLIVLYRQLGFILRLKEMGTEQDGLPVGVKAPAFDYISATSATLHHTRFDPASEWALLMFADPGCVSCQDAVAALGRIASKLRPVTRILVATDAEPALIAAVDAFREAEVEVGRVDADVARKLYRTQTTPFAYVIDQEGIIRSKGAAVGEGMIRRVVRKANRSPIEVVSAAS